MKKNLFVVALLGMSLILASCAGTTQPTQTTPMEITPRPLPYTAAYARDICDPNPVDSFDPQSGDVLCFKAGPFEGSSSESASAQTGQDSDEGTQAPTGDQSGEPAGFSISGAPGSVGLSVVLRAQGADGNGNVFDNILGLGSEMMLAEPGSILMGPDFDDAGMVNESPHMDWISPITQFTLTDPVEENANAAEGAFLWFTGATVDARVRDFHIVLEGKEGHNWFLMVRGLFADGLQDSDRNSTVTLTEYVAGHAQVMLYPPGAYISEENFMQVAETSHTSSRNCGNEGCSELSVMMLDLNTGAWVVIFQPQLDADWEFVDSNWR